MRVTTAIVCAALLAGCEGQPALQEVHPHVFSMVECWISDTAEPVVTEINLDSVRENRNQFDGSAIVRDGNWIRAPDGKGRGFERYRILSQKGNSYLIEFQSNRGGSLTTSSTIGFTVLSRTIMVDGEGRKSQVIRINSISNRNMDKPR